MPVLVLWLRMHVYERFCAAQGGRGEILSRLPKPPPLQGLWFLTLNFARQPAAKFRRCRRISTKDRSSSMATPNCGVRNENKGDDNDRVKRRTRKRKRGRGKSGRRKN